MSTPPTWTPTGDGPPRRRSVMPDRSAERRPTAPRAQQPAAPSASAPASGTAAPASGTAAPVSGTAAPSSRTAAPASRTAAPASRKAARSGAATRSGGRKRLIDYPRSGKTGLRRWLPSWRLVLGGLATLGVLGVGAFVALYVTTPVPGVADFAEAQTTTVYYADGKTEMGTFGVQNRQIVAADVIPKHVKDAVVAGEDRTFYSNPGVDPVGILRALYTNVRYGERQGGSSITQQYAERYYFDTTVTSYSGKLREAILAVKLDRQQDKDEILSNYLNTIYFGRDSYGIQTAAQSYFGVDVQDLTISQAALIAGVIPSPNNFDPRVSAEQAERRWNYVLDGMVATGALTQAERDAQEFPETVEYSRSDTYAGWRGYLLTMVRDEVTTDAGISDDELDQRGYSIITTIDRPLQREMVKSVRAMPEDADPLLHVGMVTLDPVDDAIIAVYGGADYLERQRNAVTQDTAQAGSTFKPFALTAYLENGGSLKSRYSGKNGFVVGDFTEGANNYGGSSYGQLTVVEATAKSVNAVYAQMNDEVGPDKTREAAIAAGLPEFTPGLDSVQTSNVLGTASPHPLDMARAYATFASGGLRADPYIVRSIAYLDGTVAYEGGGTAERVFEEDVMADVTYALQAVVKTGGTATKAASIGYPVAGKTGTSNSNRSAWFIGFTRQLVTAVAMYQSDEDGNPVPITPFGGYTSITGGSAPADLWTDFMAKAMEGREVLEFPAPAYVGESNVPPLVEVPDVTGMTEPEAVTALGRVGLDADVARANDPDVPEGQVISSDPGAGASVEQGTTVTITISDGPGTVEVPAVVGQTVAAATGALEGAGFTVAVVEQADASAAGTVLASDPAGGTAVEPGTTVTLTVSSGPEPEPTPTETTETPDPGGEADPDPGG